MVEMYDIDLDVKIAYAMAQAMEAHIQAKDNSSQTAKNLFLAGMPSVTIGGLLLRLRRLEVLQARLQESQQRLLEEMKAQQGKLFDVHREAYCKALFSELFTRIQRVNLFLDKCKDANTILSDYSFEPELMRRTIIEELTLSLREKQIENRQVSTAIQQLDLGLHRYLALGEFRWSSALQAVYPPRQFWWLYTKPRSN